MNNQILSTIIPAIIASITTYYVAYKNIFSPLKTKIANEQLYNVYLPLFTFLEPYLYKKVDSNIINEFLKLFNTIKQKHYELIDSDLLNDTFLLEKSLSNLEYNYYCYNSLCYTLDKLFEKNRKKLFMPTRKFSYKLNTDQLNSSTNEVLDFIRNSILDFFPIFFAGIIFYVIWAIFNQIIHLIIS